MESNFIVFLWLGNVDPDWLDVKFDSGSQTETLSLDNNYKWRETVQPSRMKQYTDKVQLGLNVIMNSWLYVCGCT